MSADKSQAKLEQEVKSLRSENLKLRSKLAHYDSKRTKSARTVWSYILTVLTGIILLPVILLVWLNHNLLDQNGYIKTMGPVLEQPAVQKAITVKASDQLFSAINVQQAVANALPSKADFLAAPIATQIQDQTTKIISNTVASPQFQTVWIRTNMAAHSAFMQTAKNGRSDPTLDISDVYRFISTQLQDTKLAPVLNKQLPPKIGEITVADVPVMAKIPHYVNALDHWRIALAGLALLLTVVVIILSEHRQTGVLRTGIAWMSAAIVTLIAIRIMRQLLLRRITNPINHAAALSIWQTVLHYLYVELAVIFLLGLAMVVAGWLLGYGYSAVRLRTNMLGLLGRLHGRLFSSSTAKPIIFVFQRYRRQFEWVLLLFIILLLIAYIPLSVGSALAILGIGILLLLVVETLATPSP